MRNWDTKKAYDYLFFMHALKIFFFYIFIILILVFVRVWNEVEHQRQLCTIYDLHLHLQKLSIKSFFNYRDGMLLTQYFSLQIVQMQWEQEDNLEYDFVFRIRLVSEFELWYKFISELFNAISHKIENRYFDISNDIFETYLNSPFKNH